MSETALFSTSPNNQIGIRRRAILCATWASCSLALLLARPSYPFPPYELLDSWFYTSYQWDLRAQIAEFGPTYYGSRLSWILPGAILHQLLPPAAAEITLKLLFSGALALGLSLTTLAVAHWRWAIVAVALAVLTPQIIIALQTDYVDGPVIVYGALALGCITISRTAKHWPVGIICAGGALAAMLVANSGAASTAGLGLAVFHLVWLRWSAKRTLQAATCYLIGALVVLSLLAFASKWCDGPLNFLQPQFEMLRYFKNTAHNPWMPENFEWLTRATWLILPLGALGWAGKRLWISRRNDSPRRRLLFALTCALGTALAAGAIIEGRGTGAVLSLYYYASYNLVFALPLVTLLAVDHAGEAGPTFSRIVLYLGIIFAVALLLSPLGTWSALEKIAVTLAGNAERIPLLLALMALLSLPLMTGSVTSRWSASGGPLLFGLWLFLAMPSGYYGREVTDRLHERYLAVHQAYFTLKQTLPMGGYRYWLGSTNRDGISLASTKLWTYRLLTEKSFPEVELNSNTEQTIIVPLSPGEGTEGITSLHRAFQHRLLAPEATRIVPVRAGHNIGFDLLLFRLQPKIVYDPAEPLPAGVQLLMLAGYEYTNKPAYTASLNIYHLGDHPQETVSTTTGYPIYHRVHPRDSVATDYRFPPPATLNQMRVLALLTYMPIEADCVMQVQDDQSQIIGEFTLRNQGRAIHNLELPPSTKAFRICFTSPRVSSTPLPVNLNVYLFLAPIQPDHDHGS